MYIFWLKSEQTKEEENDKQKRWLNVLISKHKIQKLNYGNQKGLDVKESKK